MGVSRHALFYKYLANGIFNLSINRPSKNVFKFCPASLGGDAKFIPKFRQKRVQISRLGNTFRYNFLEDSHARHTRINLFLAENNLNFQQGRCLC